MRLLVVDGNIEETRARQATVSGATLGQSYARVLKSLAPESAIDILCTADADAALPAGLSLSAYDGVVLTGSSLHLYDMTPPIVRQIDFARAVLEAGTPMFGSCWGLQVITTAAGGVVHRNPKGREMGFARAIRLNTAGRQHSLFAGKPDSFDALAIHLDEVETMAPGSVLLASNAMSDVQAIDLKQGKARAWAVQYHPEFSLGEVAAISRVLKDSLIAEGFFEHADEAEGWARDLDRLQADPTCKSVIWRHGLDRQILEDQARWQELTNWIDHLVRPVMAERQRAA